MKFKKSYIKILLFAAIFICQHSFAQVSQATLQQIQDLVKEKNSRSPIDKKIDSRLLQAVREKLGQQMVKGITLEPANVDADATGMFKADISANITNSFLSKITALGGTIIYASPKYNTVRAMVNLKTVEAIAAYTEVKFIQPAVKSMLVDENRAPVNTETSYADRVAKVRAQLTNYLNSIHPLAGKVTSEGDATHRADDVRSTYGYQGQGIKIGVLSDSYNAKGKASADVASGDLPGVGNPDGDVTPVTVVQDFASGGDEGRAMLHVIHDLAPKATLFFATADVSEASFADNIETLRNTYNCNIICDDVFYYDEPAFQDGIVAQAVDAVTASGALYFSSAGNSGSLAKGTSGVFEGDFNDAGSLVFTGSSKAGTIHNFGTVATPLNGDIITAAGTSVYNLTWSDSYGASTNDYDLFLVNSAGNVKTSSTNIQSGTQNPYEVISASIVANSDRLVVFKTTGAAVRAFHLNTNRGMLSKGTNGQTTGHASAVNAFCMAATPASTAFESGYPTGPYPNAFNSGNKVEPFSSDGPRKMFYNPDGSAISPGKFTFASNGGTTLAKPDLTAADGTKTTFSRLSGLSPFFGTSCAAPHAGAIAALLLSANPSLTSAQVRSILTSTALDIESTGYDNVTGYGIIQAFQAAGAVSTSCNSTYDGGIHNTFATAVTIPLNTDITGTISTAADTDFYKFTIATKGAGRISLTNLPADYDMYIYTAAHKLAASSKKRGTTSEVLSGNFPKGTFYIEIVGFNHAFNSTSCYTLNVSQSVGASLIAGADDSKINLSLDNANIVLYPNPVSSVLNINIPEKSIGGKLKITDAFGKTILMQSIMSSDAHINVGKFTNGTYLLTIVNKDGSVIITSKFEKQ
ncbi:MAG: S8 family serine peptidase [Parafilimonas sp.]